jgi:hypothetical protein
LAYANRPNGAAPTHVTTCAVDAYLNLENLCMFRKTTLFHNVLQHFTERNISMALYDVL